MVFLKLLFNHKECLFKIGIRDFKLICDDKCIVERVVILRILIAVLA